MSGYSGTLERVAAGHLCAGCGACAALSNKIRMKRSSEGFLRPDAEERLSEHEDQTIAKICPGLTAHSTVGPKADPLWGRIVSLRSGHAASQDLRFRASSGGALSAILVQMVESGAADYVVHTSADPEDPVSNQTLTSRNLPEITDAAGSRYAPSAPLADIERHLASGRRFVFVGKPCDVAALRAMARLDPRVDANVVCMVSFFCAGVPSKRGAGEILNRMGVDPAFLRKFRYRGHGWPGAATAHLGDGSLRQMSYRDSWGGVLSKHVQFRCKICPDGTGNAADVVCADAWYGDEGGYPEFKEADGRSLILARTEKGEAFVEAAMRSGVLTAQPHCSSDLSRMQPGQVSRMRALVARLMALWVLAQPVPDYRGFRLWRAARSASVSSLVRNFLGTGRRVLIGRR